jgi:hypothetical protein
MVRVLRNLRREIFIRGSMKEESRMVMDNIIGSMVVILKEISSKV